MLIDLHCHLLPGLDDGAVDRAESIEMAYQAYSEGVITIACTPHRYPGLYPNTTAKIRNACHALQQELQARALPIQLVVGGDLHLTPQLLDEVRRGIAPTLNNSRYLLLELPHHLCPQQWLSQLQDFLHAGYIPLLTHPERLSWLNEHSMQQLYQALRLGAWLQITGDALFGRFGRRAQYWADYLLGEGLVHVIASDAHDTLARPPRLQAAYERAAALLGPEEAEQLLSLRPQAILDNHPPQAIAPPPGLARPAHSLRRSLSRLSRLNPFAAR